MLLARDTCSAEYSATKSHPSCFLVPYEIINDKPWIYSSEYGWVKVCDIV